MELLNCFSLILPTFLLLVVAFVATPIFTALKYGWKTTGMLLVSLPNRLFSYLVLLYQKKVTKAAALVTTFSGSIRAAVNVPLSGSGFMDVVWAFGGELYNKLLGSTSQFVQGFQSLNEFFGVQGVCSQIRSLSLLQDAFMHFWFGVSALIVLLTVYFLVFGYQKGRTIPAHENMLVVLVVLFGSALAHTGVGGTVLGRLWDSMISSLESVAQVVPDYGGTNSTGLNRSVNSSSSA